MSSRNESQFDPFSLTGFFRIIKNRYWVLILFFGVGAIVAYGLVDGFTNKKESVAEWREEYGIYWVGRFTENPEVGMLMLKRIQKSFEGDFSQDFKKNPLRSFENLDEYRFEREGDRTFSLYFEFKEGITDSSLLNAIQKAVKGKGLPSTDAENQAFQDVEFQILYSSGPISISNKSNGNRGVAPRLRIRAYLVVLVLSLFIGFLVAVLIERYSSRGE